MAAADGSGSGMAGEAVPSSGALPTTADAVVIGGGLAGVACALQLLQEAPGCSVVLLEAQGRLGGRCRAWTVPGGASDAVLDEGAAWIHGTEGNPLLDVLSGREWTQFPQLEPPPLGAAEAAAQQEAAGFVHVAGKNPWMHPEASLLALGVPRCESGEELVPIATADTEAALADWYGRVHPLFHAAGVHAGTYEDSDSNATAVAHLAASAVALPGQALDEDSARDEWAAAAATPLPVGAAARQPRAAVLGWLPHTMELWMGAHLAQLQLAEMSTVEYWADYPGAHGLVGSSTAPKTAPVAFSKWASRVFPPAGTAGGVQNLLLAASSHAALTVTAGGVCVASSPPVPSGTTLHIALDSTVTEVQRGAGQAAVTSGAGVVSAPHVIATLPIGVLQADGAGLQAVLPPWKRGAIARTGSGQYVKVILWYGACEGADAPPGAWWGDAPPFWGVATAPTAGSTRGGLPPVRYIENYAALKGKPALIAVFVGPDATAVESSAPAAVLAHVQAAVGAFAQGVLGVAAPAPDPTASRISEWGTAPTSRGAYSFLATGAGWGDCGALAAPLSLAPGSPEEESEPGVDWEDEDAVAAYAGALPAPVLWFAGEAHHGEYMGTMHAALLTGRATGGAVARRLSSVA